MTLQRPAEKLTNDCVAVLQAQLEAGQGVMDDVGGELVTLERELDALLQALSSVDPESAQCVNR